MVPNLIGLRVTELSSNWPKIAIHIALSDGKVEKLMICWIGIQNILAPKAYTLTKIHEHSPIFA